MINLRKQELMIGHMFINFSSKFVEVFKSAFTLINLTYNIDVK